MAVGVIFTCLARVTCLTCCFSERSLLAVPCRSLHQIIEGVWIGTRRNVNVTALDAEAQRLLVRGLFQNGCTEITVAGLGGQVVDIASNDLKQPRRWECPKEVVKHSK